MDVSGQLHAPAALPPGKVHPPPIGQEAGWAPEPVWTLWRREKSYTCQEWNPAFQPVAHRYFFFTMTLPVHSGPWPLIQFRNLFFTDGATPWMSVSTSRKAST
jgi:hypothetical protein